MLKTWLPVVGYEQRYEVSDHGDVRTIKGRVLTPWKSNLGYVLVRVSAPRKVLRVHRLVAEAFLSNAEGKPFVNHIDADRSNNFWRNLEWCTHLENMRHAQRLGRNQVNYWVGKRSPNAALSDEQVSKIRELYATGNYSWGDLADQFSANKRTIGRIVRMESYTNV